MLGQPVSMLIPRVVGFKLSGSIPAGRDRHRRRADDHRDAAQARRRRQVRRVLRRGRVGRAAGQPRHDRQHEPGVRLDLRDLPDRRGHPRVPAPHRPLGRVRRARRGVRQGAGHVAARPGPDQPEARYSEYLELDLSTVVPSIAGPKRPQDRIVAHRGQGRVPQGPARPTSSHREGDAGAAASFPASDPSPQGSADGTNGGDKPADEGDGDGRPSRTVTVTTPEGATLRDRPRHRVDRVDHARAPTPRTPR